MTHDELITRLEDKSERNILWADLSKPLHEQGEWSDVSWGFGELIPVGTYKDRLDNLPGHSSPDQIIGEWMEANKLPSVYCESHEVAVAWYQHYGVIAWYPYEHLNVGGGFSHCYAYFPDPSYINENAMIWIARHCYGYGDDGRMPSIEDARKGWFDSVRPPKAKPKRWYFDKDVRECTPTGVPGRIQLLETAAALKPWKGGEYDFCLKLDINGKYDNCQIFLPAREDCWENMQGDHIISGKFDPASSSKKIVSMPA